jgi:reactive intermediate/imine deaminase
MTSQPTAPKRFSDADHPYSASRTGAGLIFVSGQLGVLGNEIVTGGIAAETRQALSNLESCLSAQGRDRTAVLKTTVLLADLAYRKEFDEIYADFFPKPRPARTCYAAGALPYNARVEIEAIAIAAGPGDPSGGMSW